MRGEPIGSAGEPSREGGGWRGGSGGEGVEGGEGG